MITNKIGLGGGCHWCTEGIFQSLKGVLSVQQGWIASSQQHSEFSEAIIVEYDAGQIPLAVLIEIHLHTHSSTSSHSMRNKYRSAVYHYDEKTATQVSGILTTLQADFERQIITQCLPLLEFKINDEHYLNYFYNKPQQPFCKTYIHPKLAKLKQQYGEYLNADKIKGVFV
ncbi:MAG: peptide-methionine (S)-S-oxide reductase [Phenylobacterium sp.]|jgi:peptide-methionine (S)-S-oxide reductase